MEICTFMKKIGSFWLKLGKKNGEDLSGEGEVESWKSKRVSPGRERKCEKKKEKMKERRRKHAQK